MIVNVKHFHELMMLRMFDRAKLAEDLVVFFAIKHDFLVGVYGANAHFLGFHDLELLFGLHALD